MRKKILIAVAAVLVVVTTIVCLAACKKQVDNFQTVKKGVSYIQRAALDGESNNYKARVTVGDKEKESIVDGKVVNLQPYTQIVLTLKDLKQINNTFSYKICGDKGEATGSLTKSALGVAFTAFLAEGRDKLGTVTKLIIICGEVQEEIKLGSILLDCIDADKALEYAYKAVEQEIKLMIKNGKLDCEVHVKFINNKKDPQSPSYWYVAFMKDTATCISVLIHPSDGSIISVKK